MRFFTPELYLRFNSNDEVEADRAHVEWENVTQKYQKHLHKIHDQLPAQAWQLTELSLHDAELRAIDEKIEPFLTGSDMNGPCWSTLAIVSLQQHDRFLTLIYFLCDRIRASDK